MPYQLQYKNSDYQKTARLPAEFIVLCAVAFVAGISLTVYFCVTMGGEMKMPGGWNMSMMWMRMSGQSWFLSALSFMLMWLAMMLAMMMPSAVPTFLKTRRDRVSLCCVALGYFSIWLTAGFGIYILGVGINNAAMRSGFLSNAVPFLSGASLIAAGTIQFTRWKLRHLSRCRSAFGCAASFPQNKTGFRLGCKQGLACCACCSTLMTTQLALGIMNPLVMVAVAIFITAEKLLPRPVVAARLAGIVIIAAGIIIDIRWLILKS